MTFGIFGKKREQDGWTVISGRRGIGEMLSDIKVALIVFCSVVALSAAFIYFYFFGPLAVSRHTAAGLAAIDAGNYSAAAESLENADRCSTSRSPTILKPLIGAYFASKRYEDAARVIDTLIFELTGAERKEAPRAAAPQATSQQTTARQTTASQTAAELFASANSVSPPVTEAVTALFSDEERHAGAYPFYVTGYDDLTAAYYLISEAYAYMGDTRAASDAAQSGYGVTGNAALLRLSEEIDMSAPVSLATGSAYNGRFVFHFESIPDGIKTLFTSDGTVPVPGAGSTFLYVGGIESNIGENSLRAVNVNRFGRSSVESAYRFTVFDSAGNINGNIAGGAIAVEWDGTSYYFNGDGIYKRLNEADQTKLVDGEELGSLNLLGEWLYFSRYGGADTGVYRIKTDGSGLEKLSDDRAGYIQIADGKMYYVTREGLISMTPEGTGKTVIAEGGVSHLNYAERVFYYILEDPDAETVGAGEVYCFDTERGTVMRLIDTMATWLQLEGSRLYYTAEGQEEATLLYTAGTDGADAGTIRRPAELMSGTNDTADTGGQRPHNHLEDTNIIHDGKIYVFCAGKGILFSMAIPNGLARGAAGVVEDISILAKISSADMLNTAGDDLYAYSQEVGSSSGFSPFCVRIPGALSYGGNGLDASRTESPGVAVGASSGIPPTDLSPKVLNGYVEVFGDRLYYITIDGESQSIIEADAETLSLPASDGNGGALLSGIPSTETVVYAGDGFVLTSDGVNVRLYDIPAGMETGAVVTGEGGAAEHPGDASGGVGADSAENESGGTGGSGQDVGDTADNTSIGGDGPDTGTDVTVEPVSDTPEVEPGESRAATGNSEAVPMEGSDGDNGDATGNRVGTTRDAKTGDVYATLLKESKIRQWSGMSKVFEYEDNLYYTTDAGFFRADIQFTKTVFICGDGPKSGMPFKISHELVLFEQGTLSGGAGLFVMALDGSGIRRLFESDVSAFDFDGKLLYFSDARDNTLYSMDITSAGSEAAARYNTGADIKGDSVICYGNGGFIARRPDKNFDIYYHAADGTARRLTEGGADTATYFNDRLLYASWTNNNELRYMDLRTLPYNQ